MSQQQCPYCKHCRLFKNELKISKEIEEVYKFLYCKTNKWSHCKRYEAMNEFAEIPDFLMPNSAYSIATIAHQMEQEKFIQKYIDQ